MQTDLLLDPFGATTADFVRAAGTAEKLGFNGIWTWDHLAGSVHRAPHVLEAWTMLTAAATATTTITIGPLVLNIANRSAGTLAPMAATLQQLSEGRLILGMGAGGGAKTPYAGEQRLLDRTVAADPMRRAELEQQIATLRSLWEGDGGFLRPMPAPPIVVGVFGPRMAELAGRVADGLNTQAFSPHLARIIEIAHAAHGASHRPGKLLVTVFAALDEKWLDDGRAERKRLVALGVDRVILIVDPPYSHSDLQSAARLLSRQA
jgi:alkanesulfonate monooxygenase SsuD/methylene tetrahydromethanopterin reductase-like flavin-dependent oxidoreductase (luciferase family)